MVIDTTFKSTLILWLRTPSGVTYFVLDPTWGFCGGSGFIQRLSHPKNCKQIQSLGIQINMLSKNYGCLVINRAWQINGINDISEINDGLISLCKLSIELMEINYRLMWINDQK